MKRYLAALLALVLMLTGLTVIASAETEEGITWKDGKYYYVQADGSYFKGGWKEVKETYTYESGYTETWSYWIYANADGTLVCNDWLQYGGKWYAFSWVEMVTGSYYDYDTKTTYLMGEDGAYLGISSTSKG